MKRTLAAFAMIVGVLASAGTAFALWHSTATGTGTASSTTLNPPAAGSVSATAGVATATVTVNTGPGAPSAPANGYDVKRNGAHVCYINGNTGSCQETGLAAGNYTYAIFSVIGSGLGGATPTISWTSATSASATATGVTSAASPNVPGTPDLAAASDSGASNTDNITNVTTPVFTGTITGQTGQSVHIFVDGVDKGSGSGTGSTYSVTTSALADGTHTITAKATLDGTTFSAANGSLSVTIDTVAPTGLTISGASCPTGHSCTFTGNSGHASNDVAPVVTVCATNNFPCASPQSTPTVTWNSSTGVYSTAGTGNIGNGSPHFAQATQQDVAGNQATPATTSQFSS